VQTENGEWLDVTPHNTLDDHPFLQHADTEQEFDAAFLHGPMDLHLPVMQNKTSV
jgi:hypothetical protein